MKSFFPKCLWSLLFFLCFLTANEINATHIVGGEIGYRCLGNDMYEIRLRVFRDCDTGVPWFDNPASVGVFDSNDSLIFDLRLQMIENDTLDLNLSDPCLVAPPNVCIHTTSYLDTVYLPFQTGGYQLVYQRCCRNQDIVNIVNPLGTGATFYCLITEEALLNCNSSAEFNNWPPVYICADVPISFDHSATDADGDSLVYRMCTPLDGATPADPMPQPPYNPPYNPVTWLSPNFSEANMLGGTDSLRINQNSGLLQGTPTILGVFVVGICVEEYRNGQLISTSRRDFQYAVGICGRLVTSAFFAPEIQCDNSLLVQFQNNSQSLGTGYEWYFGDSTTNASSNLDDPVYIYPDTGTYSVTLIADPGTLCSDTTTQEINLQYESILMDFDVTAGTCSDSIQLDVTDLTVDTISNIVSWDWDFGNGDTDTIPFASTVYNQSGTYVINLEVEAANGCRENISDTITLNLPAISSPDTVAICPGSGGVVLNPGGDPTHQYQWSPASGLSNPNAPSPIANPSTSTTYQVTVTAFNGLDTCLLETAVTVVIPAPIGLQALPDTATCSDTIYLEAITSEPASLEWSYLPSFYPLQSTSNPAMILVPPAPGFTQLYVRATDTYGCQQLDTLLVQGQNFSVPADFSYTIPACGEDLIVQFTDETTDTSYGPIVSWDWDFGNGQTSTQEDPIAVFDQSGTYIINLQVTTSQGCSGTAQDSIVNWTLPQLAANDTFGICQGTTSVLLNPGGDPAITYQWAPAATLDDPTLPSPTASPTVPTTYTVTMTSNNGGQICVHVDTVFVGFPPPISVSVPDYQYCGTSVTLEATSSTAVNYEWSNNVFFNPILGSGNPITLTPQTVPFSGFYVLATDAYGCTATDFSLVEQIFTNVNVDFDWDPPLCNDTLAIQFNNLTADTVGTTISFLSWTVSNGQSSTAYNPVFNFTQSGTYVVTLNVLLANGCSGTHVDTLDLNVATLVGPNTAALCEAAISTELNPNGDSTGVTYQWSPSTGLNDPFSHNPIATPPASPMTYTVTMTATNSFGNCTTVDQVTIVDAPPISVQLPPDTTFCSSPFLLMANVSNGVQLLEWSLNPNFNPVLFTNTNPLNFSFGSFPTTYIMYARVTDQYGCSVVDTVNLFYETAPVLVDFQATPSGCNPDSLFVQFTDLTTDTSNASIASWNWDFGNGNTSAAQNPSFSYGAADTTHQFSLEVILNNGCSGILTDSIAYQLPDFVGPDSVGLCGNSTPIMLNPGGNPDFSYQWSPATGLSATNIASPILTPTTNITYNVTITAPNGGDTCVAVQQMHVFADSFEFEAMPDTLICANQIELYVNAPSATNVEWALDPNFNLILGSGNPYFTNLNSDQWFYVRGENAFGCTAVDSTFIRVRLSPINVDFSMDLPFCQDSLLVNFYDQTSDTTANPLIGWNWDFGTGDSSTDQNPTYTYPQTGNYQVSLSVITENGCSGAESLPLYINNPGLANATDSLISCSGDPTELNPNADTSLIYQWSPASGLSDPTSPNPIATISGQQTYNVTITNINQLGAQTDSCTIIEQITVLQPPPVSVQASGPSLACDTTVQLSATASTNIGVSYLWDTDPNFTAPISTGSSPQIIQNTSLETYYVQLTDSYGCSVIDSVQIEQRAILASIDSAAVACPNEPASLTVTNLNPNDVLAYFWQPDLLVESGQGTASITSAPTVNTLFSVILSNQFGCTDTLSSLVSVSSTYPNVDITANPDTIFVGDDSELEATLDPTYSYEWAEDPTLSSTSIFNPIASPQQATIYYVTVTDPAGCRNQDSIIIYTKNFICEEPYIFVPNAFTPNNDGLNDLLYVRGNVITELYFAIYNRWGEKIFETTDQNIGWDGTFKGKALPPDAYGYYLRYKCVGQGPSDDYQHKKGNVTIIR
jgi:gliding motility-associated-like protein